MRIVLQRVAQASVTIDGSITGQIDHGYLILAGFEDTDSEEDLTWMARKIISLRVFNDEAGKMNLDIKDVGGRMLVVSQFTLHAKTKKGTRPSFVRAAKPDIAIPLYEQFVQILGTESGTPVETGKFGAMMEVALVNDGPVTILLDTKNKDG